MTAPTTYEATLLLPLETLIVDASSTYEDKFESRLQILEYWASDIGGFDYSEYCASFGIKQLFNIEELHTLSSALTSLSKRIGVEEAFIISALSREPLPKSEQKESGAYYTDFRLAQLIGEQAKPHLSKEKTVADLASGTGILLVAVASSFKQQYPNELEDWLKHNVFAFDMSGYALRGCRIALATYLSEVKGIQAMTKKWRLMDSLLDVILPVRKFDILVGNPPWGKIKISRHSHLLKNGSKHIYGSDYERYDEAIFETEKRKIADYNKRLRAQYDWLKKTESDMYIAFLERAFGAIRESGRIFMLLPAGIIRSQGTYLIREELVKKCSNVNLIIFSNRARFFTIDTRFKFLLLNCDLSKQGTQIDGIQIAHADGNGKDITISEAIRIPLLQLRKARPDLTIPEVRTNEEMGLYFRIHENGKDWANAPEWSASITRELDMTNDKKIFKREPNGATIALVEGRMVQQHWFAVKKYISGTGRSAKWEPGGCEISPQFWIDPKDLSESMNTRVQSERVGYCDIAGQTNERTMMSAIIPAGVACGNKVPTIIFNNSHGGKRESLWVGITNSFTYDWMLRRIISTTANYFLILSVPMPAIEIDSDLAITIITATRKIKKMRSQIDVDQMMVAMQRCQIDIAVAEAYGLGFNDMKLILEDFPILDRKQTPIKGEQKSTITRDFLLFKAANHFGVSSIEYKHRFNEALTQGAIPYMPADIHR